MCIRSILPYFVWVHCIPITNVSGLHFRYIGGFTNSGVTQMLSQIQKMTLQKAKYLCHNKLMDAKVNYGRLPNEKQAHNSLNV